MSVDWSTAENENQGATYSQIAALNQVQSGGANPSFSQPNQKLLQNYLLC